MKRSYVSQTSRGVRSFAACHGAAVLNVLRLTAEHEEDALAPALAARHEPWTGFHLRSVATRPPRAPTSSRSDRYGRCVVAVYGGCVRTSKSYVEKKRCRLGIAPGPTARPLYTNRTAVDDGAAVDDGCSRSACRKASACTAFRARPRHPARLSPFRHPLETPFRGLRLRRLAPRSNRNIFSST